MKQDGTSLYAELNELGKAATEAAQISQDINVYFAASGARNKFRDMTIESKLSANNKSPYFIKLIESDRIFFENHRKEYREASVKFSEVSSKYLTALFNAANISDIKNDLDRISKNVREDCSNIISPNEIIVEVAALSVLGNDLYKEIEKNYLEILGINLR